MRRRTFLALLPTLAMARSRRRVAVTMDDVNWEAIPKPHSEFALGRILDQVGSVRGALFVTGANVESEHGRRILAAFSDAGHVIANHTYDHVPLIRTDPEAFCRSIARNQRVIETYPTFRKWFRFPALKEGDTPEVRDAVRDCLERLGYRNGHVTIDASDWYYDQRLRRKLSEDPAFPVERFRKPYWRTSWTGLASTTSSRSMSSAAASPIRSSSTTTS